MRYLVTEFNIKSNLEGNPHLTNQYGMEFARKVAELMARPEIEAMYVHSVPYHAITYWSNGKRIATVIGGKDSKLARTDLTRGWHLTPAGKVWRLYSKLAWNGEVVLSGSSGRQMWWVVRSPDGRLVITFLNDDKKSRERKLKIDGREIKMVASARSIVLYDGAGSELERLALSY
jgi:hypothetical protein